jgi:hypothetical protein
LAERTNKVAALITVESIIVALLVAFGSGINQALLTSIQRGESVLGVIFAGLLISVLALTAFRSVLLLYRSIDISDVDDAMRSDERYRVGYDLFLMVILLTGVYVLVNAFSLLHYAVAKENVSACGQPSETQNLIIIVAGIFSFIWGGLSVFYPFWLTKFFRRIRDKRKHELLHLGEAFGLICTILFFAIVLLQSVPSLEEWACSPVPILFNWITILLSTFAVVMLLELATIWMLMMTENA